MTNLMTSSLNKWILRAIFLFIALFCMALIPPVDTLAAAAKPQDFSPSSYIPYLRNNVCSGTRTASNRIGVQMYGNTGYNEEHFQLLQNTETSWIRNSIFWSAIEAVNLQPSEYNWVVVDNTLQAAKDNCANMIVTIDHTPEWAWSGGDRSPIQPEFLPEYAQFVRAVVERYDGDGIDDAPGGMVVTYWELYNEPDFGPSEYGGGWGEYGERYAEMLEIIYSEVKAANPDAQVVFGGIAYNYFTEEQNGLFTRKFLDDVLEAGGGEFFDIMNVHHYPFPNGRRNWTNSNSSGLVEKVADINQKLAAYDLTKPLIITEVGWHSDANALYPSTDDFQGRYVVQLLTQALSVDAIAAIWWSFADPTNYNYSTGLTIAPNTRKPSYGVYRQAVKRLGTNEFVQTVLPATETDLEVYEFRETGAKKTFYVAWLNPIAPFNAAASLTFDDTTTVNWEVSGSVATVYRKEGTLLQTVSDENDGVMDGKITVAVGRNPLYIVID